MLIAGGIGTGLVVGWLAARLLDRARWTVFIRVLLGVIAEGLLIFYIAAARTTLWFGISASVGALVGLLWIRSLEARRLMAESLY